MAAAATLLLTVLAPLVLLSLHLPVAEGRIIDWVHGEQEWETARETRPGPGSRRGKHNVDKKGDAEEGRARTGKEEGAQEEEEEGGEECANGHKL